MSSNGSEPAHADDALEAELRSARGAAEPSDAGAGLAALKRQLFGARAEPAAGDTRSRIGRYELRRVLGRGAMGVVYEAWDPELARTVALKRLSLVGPARAGEVPAVQRLRREARAMARLDDPHVLRVYDVDELQGQPFVAMEYAPFGTLASWLETQRTTPEIVAALLCAGRGLSAAHRAGLVHRDVKPSNLLCSGDGRFKIGDFGLVGEADAGGATPPMDAGEIGAQLHTRGSVGTPAYMAPEVWAGRPASPAADQYGFCVVLYEALYRERPFAGRPDRDVLPPARSADQRRVPRLLRRVLARGLAFDPEARFASMDELLAALERSQRPASRRVTAALVATALSAMVALALAATGGWPVFQRALREVPASAGVGAGVDFGGWSARLREAQLDFAAAARARAALIAVMRSARAQDRRARFPDLAQLLQRDPALRQRWFQARHAFETALGSRVIGRIPTHALALGEATHPFVQLNLAAEQLARAGLPLSPQQRTRAAAVGADYERALRARAARYDATTLAQQRFLDEAELKHAADVAFRATLSARQRAELVLSGGEHVLTWDEYGPASMLSEALVPVALRADTRAELPEALRAGASELLGLPLDPALPELASTFEEMAAAVTPHILTTQLGQLAITVDDALAQGRIMEAARRRLLGQLPGSNPARASLINGNGFAVFYARGGAGAEIDTTE